MRYTFSLRLSYKGCAQESPPGISSSSNRAILGATCLGDRKGGDCQVGFRTMALVQTPHLAAPTGTASGAGGSAYGRGFSLFRRLRSTMVYDVTNYWQAVLCLGILNSEQVIHQIRTFIFLWCFLESSSLKW